ncbi:MAG: hypothetical protein QXQ91_00065 [Nanopusillaceae archaeon]
MDVLPIVSLAGIAIAGYYFYGRGVRRVGKRAEEEFAILRDICANKWVLARFQRRSPLGNEWVAPRLGYVLYMAEKPSRVDVVIGNKVYQAVEAIGCSPIFTTEQLGDFLKNVSIAEVAIGDRYLDPTDPNALERLYRYLASAYEEARERGGRIYVTRWGGVKLAFAVPDFARIGGIVANIAGLISKTVSASARNVDALAEVQRLARLRQPQAPWWLMPVIMAIVIILAMLFAFRVV